MTGITEKRLNTKLESTNKTLEPLNIQIVGEFVEGWCDMSIYNFKGEHIAFLRSGTFTDCYDVLEAINNVQIAINAVNTNR